MALKTNIVFRETLLREYPPPELQQRLPDLSCRRVEILGLIFDRKLSLGIQIDSALRKAKVRPGVLADSLRRTWGLEPGPLKTTSRPVMARLIRRRLAAMGAGAPREARTPPDTPPMNTASKKGAGLGDLVREPALYMDTGLMSSTNVSCQTCDLA